MVFLNKTRALVFGIGFILIGLGCVIYGTLLTVNLKKPAVDLYSTDWTTLKTNQHVEVDLDFLIDPYMVFEDDKGKETSRVYTIPDLIVADDGMVYMSHFIGVAVTSNDFDKFDKIVSNSWEWWNDEEGTVEFGKDTVHLDGYLRKASSNDKKFMKEYLHDMGYSDDEIAQMYRPYVLMTNGSSMKGVILAGAFMFVLGVASLIYAIFRFIQGR